jgi:DNA polymerase elongation subunit (family B)
MDREFKLVDFTVLSDFPSLWYGEEMEEEQDVSEKRKNKTKFIIQMFAINDRRETASIFVTTFEPFFYLKVGNNWNNQTKNEFLRYIETQVGNYYQDDILQFKYVKHKKLYGFDGGVFHNFIIMKFNSIQCFNKVKNLWYSKNDFGDVVLNDEGVRFKDTKIEIYESNIPPLLRFFHLQSIYPSGWITLPKTKTLIVPSFKKSTHCDFECHIRWCDIISCQENENRVPYKICSFDIEASSSHGDFPIPVKSYKKLAQNIVDYFIALPTNLITKEDAGIILTEMIFKAFQKESITGSPYPSIDYVYPQNKEYPKNIQELQKSIEKWFQKEVNEELFLQKDIRSILSIENYYSKIKDLSTIDERNEDVNAETNDASGAPDTETPSNVQWTKKPSKAKKETSYNNIVDLLLYGSNDGKIERNELIDKVNASLCSVFPKLEGDKVTFIGSTFLEYGKKEPYLNHCVVLDTCQSPDDLSEKWEIESYPTEGQVLVAWRDIIQKEDPDIIIGYNIFGFDYQFMFHRANECECLEEFLLLSRNRNEICATKSKDEYTLEKLNLNIASGSYELSYIKIPGRIQVDLYMHFRREENLPSYKLDYVANHFIGDYVMEMIESEDTTCVKTQNMSGMTVGSFVHFEIISYTTDYYNDGEKFMIEEMNTEEKYFVIRGKLEVEPKTKMRWGVAKDNVTPKDIFRLTKGDAFDRFIVAKYCIQDCNLVHYLFAKADIFTSLSEMANICSVPINFIIFRGQGIKLLSYVAKKCREKNTLLPVISKGSMYDAYEGAIVLEPKCNLYLNHPIPVGDFASLYPSSMISENLCHSSKVWTKSYNLQKELIYETGVKNRAGEYIYDNLENYTYVDVTYDTYRWYSKKKVLTGYKVCRFAQFPNNEKAIMPSILQELLQARKSTKKLMASQTDDFIKNVYDKRQLAYKITANSLYGQCGAKTSAFYEQDIAAATTATGRLLLNYAKTIVEKCYFDRDIVCNDGRKIKSNAEYVYGDTDSVFFNFNLKDADTNQPILGMESLSYSIEIAQQATHTVSKFLKQPHDFEYEKTFFPFCLLSKKRYVGMMYETNIQKCKRKEMGIVLKRRDNAPIVKDVYGNIIDILMKEMDVSKAVAYLHVALEKLMKGEFPIHKLIISKALNSNYKKPEQIAHKVLADRIGLRDPGNKPSTGDRIPFVYIQTKNKNALQGEKIENPDYVLENKLKIDYGHYISNQIMKPVQQLLSLVLYDLWRQQNKNIHIRRFDKEIEKVKRTIVDFDKLNDKIQDMKNAEVKKLIFDKYLLQIENDKQKNNTIGSYFKKL